MGVSTNAVLFYGYCWGEESELFERPMNRRGELMEWPEIILQRRGVKNPWDDAPADLDEYLPRETYDQQQARAKAWTDAHRAELDAWYAAKRAVEAEFEVEIGSHCSGECSMPYLAVTDQPIVATRGNPEEIDIDRLILDSTGPATIWTQKLDRFIAEFGIEKPHPAPKWWMVSYWG